MQEYCLGFAQDFYSFSIPIVSSRHHFMPFHVLAGESLSRFAVLPIGIRLKNQSRVSAAVASFHTASY